MDVLPDRSLTAAANMAVDECLLRDWPAPEKPRFRHYRWNEAAFTFGRTQRWDNAAARLPVHATWREAHTTFARRFALIRRSSGGGLVDHRDDWTYALVIPTSHPLARGDARRAYREVHGVLAWALRAQDITATLAPAPDTAPSSPATACFQRAEPDDVIGEDGKKLAGAAQRRTREGLLFQGSLARSSVRALDWERFKRDFTGALAEWLGGTPSVVPFPAWAQTTLAERIAHYQSDAWNRRR